MFCCDILSYKAMFLHYIRYFNNSHRKARRQVLNRLGNFSHAAELVEQLDVVGIQFALQDEFAVVFPPVEKPSVLHFSFVGQVAVLLHIGQELRIMLLPVLFSL